MIKSAYKPKPKHTWSMTDRNIPGAILRFHACTSCYPNHLKVFDMFVSDPGSFQGEVEYEARSHH